MKSMYENKYFSILGDSISTLDGYSEPKDAVFYDISCKLESGILTPADTWWGRIIDTLGGRLLVNNSFSGSTVCYHPFYEIPSYGCSDERTGALGRDGILPDVIMVYMGANDRGYAFPVEDDKSGSPTSFLPAYSLMLDKLKRNYPDAEIWCFTLPVSKCDSQDGFSFPFSIGGRHISEYCDAIKKCAKIKDCRVIDLYSTSEPFDTIDGIHASAEGMKMIAQAVISAVMGK